MVREVKEQDFEALVKLGREFFPTHNKFQLPEEQVVAYLKEQAAKHTLLVAEDEGKIQGFLVLVCKGQNIDASHKIWKFRHFVFVSEDVGKGLLSFAEEELQKGSATSKVELSLAEGEKGIDFYRAQGYEQEGALKNHYRWGETCYVLSKSFPKT